MGANRLMPRPAGDHRAPQAVLDEDRGPGRRAYPHPGEHLCGRARRPAASPLRQRSL